MKMKRLSLLILTILSILSGCGREPGSDALSSHGGYQPVGIGECMRCHSSTLNPLITNGAGTDGKHIRHVSEIGLSCTKCHLNYRDNPSHMNGRLDTGDPAVLIVYFDPVNGSGEWINDTGPKTGSCTSTACHGSDTVDWYSTAGWTTPACSICHSAPTFNRRQIMGSGGDFALNPSIKSHHITSADDPLPEQCLVCHDLSHHTAGMVILKNADTGIQIYYTAPQSLEPFCLSCHDTDGAGGNMSPFNDGSILGQVPYKMSAEIKTHWNKTYGHRRAGLTCFGNGNPATGCHSNGHGSIYVGVLSKNMTLPLDDWNWFTPPDNEFYYELCFNCHHHYPGYTKEDILGAKQGGNYDLEHQSWGATTPYYIPAIQTRFRDKNNQGSGKTYDDPSFWFSYFNLHFFHIQGGWWLYRDTYDSSISCIACHNVHGSNTRWGWLYDTMQYNHYLSGGDEYGTMDAPDYSILSQFPTSCAFNCHSIQGKTYNWFEPSGE
jgi:hypothetical protein